MKRLFWLTVIRSMTYAFALMILTNIAGHYDVYLMDIVQQAKLMATGIILALVQALGEVEDD